MDADVTMKGSMKMKLNVAAKINRLSVVRMMTRIRTRMEVK